MGAGPGSSGPGKFRASIGRKPTTRSRYVDTFNTGGDVAADSAAMPPPTARPKPAAPAYKVFTPQKAAGTDDDAAAGSSTPLFMTPTADVTS